MTNVIYLGPKPFMRQASNDLTEARCIEFNLYMRAICKSYVECVEAARNSNWFGYADRDAYISDGLMLDPKSYDWVIQGIEMLNGKLAAAEAKKACE